MYRIEYFTTADGRSILREWLDNLPDAQAAARVVARITRLGVGAFGDCKPLQRGIWELRIDHGPGYRLYYAKIGGAVVLLLCGGDKRRQRADIERAVAYLEDYKRRNR